MINICLTFISKRGKPDQRELLDITEFNSFNKNDWKKEFNIFPEKFIHFVGDALKNKENKLFDFENSCFTFENSDKLQPFIIKTFHRSYKLAEQFLK